VEPVRLFRPFWVMLIQPGRIGASQPSKRSKASLRSNGSHWNREISASQF
jgi:hypothetical protein